MTMQNKSVSVVKATATDKSTVANLIQLYLYDMTDEEPFPLERNGLFSYDMLERFWQHPYLLFYGEELAGFALVVTGNPVTSNAKPYFLAEFFILRGYRGKGLGTDSFNKIVQYHPGLWEIGAMEKNTQAKAYWAKTLSPYQPTSFPHRFEGDDWLIHAFTSHPL